MVLVSQWLEQQFPNPAERKNIKVIRVKEQLVGELDLKDFTYEDGVKIYLAPHLDKRQLSIINQPAKSQVIQLQEAQEWLDKNYPKNTRSKEKYLYIPHKNLTGFLNLNDFTNLEKLDCSNNKFTGQHLSVIT